MKKGENRVVMLDHIGVAVTDLPGVTKLLTLFGLRASGTETVAEQGVRTHFFPFSGDDSSFELLEPIDPCGTVAKFIEKKGPGIHHLSFRVAVGELDGLSATLRSEGYRLLYSEPKRGAHHMRINFIHPASAGGILIELMEPGSTAECF